MEFRRNASERRRRVLIEENLQESGSSTAAARSNDQQTPLHNYSDGAQRTRQPHLTDLLPKRPWTLSVLGLSGLSVIAGVIALYGVSFVQPFSPAISSLAALDLGRADSLAGWFSAAALLGGCNLAVIIYLLRRHRVDDYRGRYRVWIWFAALLLLSSIEVIAGLRHIVGQLVHDFSPMGERFTPQVWSVLIVVFFGSITLIRAAIEVRRSRGSSSMLAMTFVCYAFVALDSALYVFPASEFHTLIDGSCLLLGHLALVSTLVIYARFVYLDAHGHLAVRARKPRAAKKVKEPKTTKADADRPSKQAETRRRSDLEVEGSEKKPSATITAANRPIRIDPPIPVTSDNGERKLSKAERKKLRREMRSA